VLLKRSSCFATTTDNCSPPTRGSDAINDQAIFGLVVFFCTRAAVALIEEQKNQVGARTDSDKLLTDRLSCGFTSTATRHKIGHFGDVSPSRSLGCLWEKTKPTQQSTHTPIKRSVVTVSLPTITATVARRTDDRRQNVKGMFASHELNSTPVLNTRIPMEHVHSARTDRAPTVLVSLQPIKSRR